MPKQTAVPWDGRRMYLDADELATAYLVYLDVLADGYTGRAATMATALRLADQPGIPDAERTTLAVAARICHERGIEP